MVMDYISMEELSPPISKTPKRGHMSWQGTSWLMLTDVVGTSVLTFAGVAASLGWVLTIAFIGILMPVAVYTAVLMARTRKILITALDVESTTMGECARHALGGDRVARLVYFFVYFLFAFFGNASYLLTLGNALRGAVYDVGFCDWQAVLISCACVTPVVICVRRLSDSIGLCFLNLFLIVGVLTICLGQLIYNGRGPEVKTFMFAEDLSLLTAFGAMTNVLYSYTGHWVYFELMTEMEEPEHFPRVFWINAPLQTVLYLTVALVGYYFCGSEANGFLLSNLPTGLPYRVASAILFVNILIAFMLKNVVLAKFLHGTLSPRVEETSWRARAEFAACGLSLLFVAFFVANAIPFFSDFLGLVGGLLSGPISFLLPMALYVGARRKLRASRLDLLAPEKANIFMSSTEPLVARADMVAFMLIGILTLLTMVVGSYSNVKNILDHMAQYGAPFTCHPTQR